jgi:hypothetical protein
MARGSALGQPFIQPGQSEAIFGRSRLEGIESRRRFAEKGMLASPPFPGHDADAFIIDR